MSIDVEVNVANQGFPSFDIVGLPSKAVAESRDRVKTALINSGFSFPNKKITINLAPADMPKEGSYYDLPIAVGLMSYISDVAIPSKSLFYGEVSLDGGLRHTTGILLAAIHAKEKGIQNIFIPSSCANEASIVKEMNVFPVDNLSQLFLHLNGQKHISPYKNEISEESEDQFTNQVDMADVLGQHKAKRALQIAIAGGHNVMMQGPPGAGKTLLAKAISSILPPLSYEESLDVTRIYSSAGHILPNRSLITQRQVRSPHHTISYAGMVGGGVIPKPGEISLAHRGVLFLDEIYEFSRYVLESLRQPMEDGEVTISRSFGSITFPTKFLLIAACNPCPCGYHNSNRPCTCTQFQINRYKKRVSGPLMDRIDLFVEINAVEKNYYLENNKIASQQPKSEEIRKKIIKVREIQSKRFLNDKILINAEMKNSHMSKYCKLNESSNMILYKAVEKYNLSARAYFKLIRVARTIADMDESFEIKEEHIAEAIQFRNMEI